MGLLKRIFGARGDTGPAAPRATSPRAEPEPVTISEISPRDLKARLDAKQAVVVVDMRQPWEYQAGHIPGAIHMFLNDIPERFRELPHDADIVFQCWQGATSLDACAFLIGKGWPAARVASLSGGIAGWVEEHAEESLVSTP